MRQTCINTLQVEEDSSSDDEDIPLMRRMLGPPEPIFKVPFYITFELNGFTLRNCILNSGSPINIMPSTVMK